MWDYSTKWATKKNKIELKKIIKLKKMNISRGSFPVCAFYISMHSFKVYTWPTPRRVESLNHKTQQMKWPNMDFLCSVCVSAFIFMMSTEMKWIFSASFCIFLSSWFALMLLFLLLFLLTSVTVTYSLNKMYFVHIYSRVSLCFCWVLTLLFG